jgi:N-acetylglutamate synthase/N-acetylornithine aminotransferase
VYQASLTDRSVTVTATCEMAGMVPEMATMVVLCLMWLC